MATLGLLDLLKLNGFAENRPAKLVRHKDWRYDVQELIDRGWFDAYQGCQSKPVFDGCDRIVSFVGHAGTTARFVGVYRVLAKRNGLAVPLPEGCPYVEWRENHVYYELAREPQFDDLVHRLIVQWGAGARAFVPLPVSWTPA